MDWSLLLSGLAVLISLASWIETLRSRRAASRSADAAEDSAEAAATTAELDLDRRHEELAPEVFPSDYQLLEKQGGALVQGVVVDVDVHDELQINNVSASLLPLGAGPQFTAIQSLETRQSSDCGGAIDLGPMPRSKQFRIGLERRLRDDNSRDAGSGRVQLRFQAQQGRSWVRTFAVSAGGDPRAFFV